MNTPHVESTTAQKIAALYEKLEKAKDPGSPRAIAKREEEGTPSARERIHMLLDPGSFVELCNLASMGEGFPYGDGVVIGYGTIDGRQVAVFSHDKTVFGGTVGEIFGRKMAAIHDWAIKVNCPLIGINDSGGARIQDAVTSLAWYAKTGARQLELSGRLPQISIILGKCAGGAVYAPANTDLVVGVHDQAYMFVTGPDVLKEVTGEEITMDELGGATAQARNGNIHHVAESEQAAFDYVRDYLSYLPSSTYDPSPRTTPIEPLYETELDKSLNSIIPDSDNSAYNMHDVINALVDGGEFLEFAALWAPNVIVGFGRINGRVVGIVANQPQYMSGVLDIDSSEKGARFIRLCNCYKVTLLYLVDVPGILPGLEQERGAVIRRGAKFMYSFVEASIPKITVVIRKAYGGGYAVMGSKQLGSDINFAWPSARIAVMGAESAVTVVKKRELAEAAPEDRAKIRQDFIDFYNEHMANPYMAAERGYIDAVIEPSKTRLMLGQALELIENKKMVLYGRKQGLMPI